MGMCCRNKKLNRNYTRFLNGTQKYRKDIDITTILSTVRKVEWLYDFLLDEKTKELEQLGRHYLIPEKEDHQENTEEKKDNDEESGEGTTASRNTNYVKKLLKRSERSEDYDEKVRQLVNNIPYISSPDTKEQVWKLLIPKRLQSLGSLSTFREIITNRDLLRTKSARMPSFKRLDVIYENSRLHNSEISEEESKELSQDDEYHNHQKSEQKNRFRNHIKKYAFILVQMRQV